MDCQWFWDAVNAIATCASTVLTTILTWYIIQQTNKNQKKQEKMEKQISEHQMDLQLRQIKVDLFPYKRELYIVLSDILEFAEMFYIFASLIDLNNSSYSKIYEIYKSLEHVHLKNAINKKSILEEAKYILPEQIYPTILDISREFNSLCSFFIMIKSYPSEDIDGENADIKFNIIKSIKDACKLISDKKDFINNIMLVELNIASLDR